MIDRRALLGGIAATTAAVSGITITTGRRGTATAPPAFADAACRDESGGPTADRFPNVKVWSQDGRAWLFYEDLIKGRTVLVNFMSIANDAQYPVTGNLARVQAILGDRLGRDVVVHSITVDPLHDTPDALRVFAERHGVRPGWRFLTAEPAAIDAIKNGLFYTPGHTTPHHQQDCSVGIVRYGHEPAGLWGSVPARADPFSIVERLSWVQPRPMPTGQPRRRGPQIRTT
jgi:protein SCO1/2